MVVPLAMAIWFAFQRYNLLIPDNREFVGFANFAYILTDPTLWISIGITMVLVVSVLAITIGLGTVLAVLFNQEFPGRGVARVLAISPFFVMPTVSALIWKNMLMHPVNGLFAQITRGLGLGAIDWFADFPLLAIIIIVAWQWLPFALLILLTAIQSLDTDQMEAARMDGRQRHAAVPLCGAAPPQPGDRRGRHDRDHFLSHHLCRNLRHHWGRALASPPPTWPTTSTSKRCWSSTSVGLRRAA
jgi:sorbitol/mannitol transport system permease protein